MLLCPRWSWTILLSTALSSRYSTQQAKMFPDKPVGRLHLTTSIIRNRLKRSHGNALLGESGAIDLLGYFSMVKEKYFFLIQIWYKSHPCFVSYCGDPLHMKFPPANFSDPSLCFSLFAKWTKTEARKWRFSSALRPEENSPRFDDANGAKGRGKKYSDGVKKLSVKPQENTCCKYQRSRASNVPVVETAKPNKTPQQNMLFTFQILNKSRVSFSSKINKHFNTHVIREAVKYCSRHFGDRLVFLFCGLRGIQHKKMERSSTPVCNKYGKKIPQKHKIVFLWHFDTCKQTKTTTANLQTTYNLH